MRATTKVVLGAIAFVGGALLVGRIATVRFARGVERDVRDLLSTRPSALPRRADALPPPVERYRARAVVNHAPIVQARMEHGGSFRPSVGERAYPIAGSQVFTADPPGFVWEATVKMGPATWFSARDLSIGGRGDMRVLVDSLIPVVDARGPALDEGALFRVLAEMVWYPTAFFDARYVTWAPIDEERARATLRIGEQAVSVVFVFGADDLPSRCEAERPNEQGVRKPWGGRYADWRSIDGILVPFEAEVSWELDGGRFTYAHWRLDWIRWETAS